MSEPQNWKFKPSAAASVQSSTITTLQGVLASPEWDDLTHQLLDYVEDFQYKIVPARPGFQM